MEEAFLDVARARARSAGRRSRSRRACAGAARERVGLAVSVGVARTKTLAKMASRAAKPDGLLVVAPDDERDFLDPLPVESLWGVGPATAGAPARARDRDRRPTRRAAAARRWSTRSAPAAGTPPALGRPPRRPAPGAGRTRAELVRVAVGLGRRRRSAAEVDANLIALVDRVTRRMRSAGRVGRTVVLRLRFRDFKRATRSRTLACRDRVGRSGAARRPRPVRGGAADDPPPRPDHGRDRDHQPRAPRRRRAARAAARPARRPPGSTPRSTSCATATATTRSPAAALLRAGPELAPWVMPGDR